MEHMVYALLSFATTAFLIAALLPKAEQLRLVDNAGGHKVHGHGTPLIGGIAMFGGLSLCVFFAPLPSNLYYMIFAAGILLLVGTVDDIVALSPITRFLSQITASLIMILSADVQLIDFGKLISNEIAYTGSWAIALSVFSTVGVINALNMSDGVDGLAGGFTLIALTGLGIAVAIAGTPPITSLFTILIGVISAFLLFNMRTPWQGKARTFMGNGGSMVLGLVLAWLFIDLSQASSGRVITPITALWLLALPLIDTVVIMTRRLMKGCSPFAADREHLHHLIMAYGFTPGQSVAILLGAGTFFAAVGLLTRFFNFPEYVMFYSFVVLFIFSFTTICLAWRYYHQHTTRTVNSNQTQGNSASIHLGPRQRK